MKYTTRIAALTFAAWLVAAGSASAQKTKPETQASLAREAKITKLEAAKTALAQVPGGKVRSTPS